MCQYIKSNEEKVPTSTKSKWKDSSIEKMINNKIYVGDYERFKRVGKEQGKESVIYRDVVEPIISRKMIDEVQVQKEKNQRAFCRDRVYLFMQKLICPKCGKLLTCKGTGGKKKKYMYYHCCDCKLYLREDIIEEMTMPMIMDLIEYDMTVKQYFFPVLADKKERDTANLDKEIANLQNQKNRIKEAYLKGIVEVNDFSEDYKVIEEKLNKLEEKRIQAIDLNKQTFSPQAIMADRDVEKEKLIRSNKFKDMLMAEWNKKTKEEKQEFISKFVESITIDKDEKGYYKLVNIKFRSSFIEQIDKLYDKGIVDVPSMIERDGKFEDIKVSVNMNKDQLDDYLSSLKKELDISYMDLGEYYFHDDRIDENYDTKTQVAKIRNRAIEFKLKKNQKVIRLVAMKEFKNYMARPEGKLRLGLVTHTTSKKKHK